MKSHTARGEVTIPLVTFIGTVTVVAMTFVGFVINSTSNLSGEIDANGEADVVQGERITVLETRTERIPYLEAKVDRLLEERGINPAKVLPAAVISATETSTGHAPQQTLMPQ